MFTINESIEELKKEIEEKQSQIILLEKNEKGEMEFTEENYHKLCKTNFRGSEDLGKKFEEIFPFLKFTKAYSNEYTYFLKINNINYKVTIPCCTTENISVVIPRPSDCQTEENELQRINEIIEKIEKGLKTKTIFERANFLFENCKKPFRILVYLIKYKNKKNYIKKLTEIKEDLKTSQNFYINKIEEIKKEKNEYNKTIKTFTEIFAPKFLKWTNTIVIKGIDRCYLTNDLTITIKKQKEN